MDIQYIRTVRYGGLEILLSVPGMLARTILQLHGKRGLRGMQSFGPAARCSRSRLHRLYVKDHAGFDLSVHGFVPACSEQSDGKGCSLSTSDDPVSCSCSFPWDLIVIRFPRHDSRGLASRLCRGISMPFSMTSNVLLRSIEDDRSGVGRCVETPIERPSYDGTDARP